MKIFVISLTSSVSRRTSIRNQFDCINIPFEFVDAVDGRGYTEEDLRKYTDFERVMAQRNWLSNGAVGCALSHLKVYERILAENLDYALVLEDDVLLKPDFPHWINEIDPYRIQADITLLYFTSWNPCILLRQSEHHLAADIVAYTPKDIFQPITAAAYIVKSHACKRMLDQLKPVAWTADSWGDFIRLEIISSLHCVYPMPVSVTDAKSTIDYVEGNKMAKVFSWIDRYKIFPFHLLLKMRRKWMRNKMLSVIFE